MAHIEEFNENMTTKVLKKCRVSEALHYFLKPTKMVPHTAWDTDQRYYKPYKPLINQHGHYDAGLIAEEETHGKNPLINILPFIEDK